MYFATYTSRAKSPEDAEQICRLFRHSLNLRQEPGFTQAYCTVDVDDPRAVFVVELWGNLPSLRAWVDSAAHRQLLQQITPLIEGPVETILYEELP